MSDLIQFLGQQEERFVKLDKAKLLNFKQECLFARQQIMKNDFTFKVASENPASLQAAVLNIAAIGISLNPAQAHAYLVPRDGGICLDISYKGLVKLATDCGAIKDCKSVLVYEGDEFKWKGPYKEPKHEADPFSAERTKVKGAYNIAYLNDGRVMVEVMSKADLDKVESTSKAKNGPWKTWKDQMQLKTVTKRAYKSWPQTENRERLDRAVEVLHETEGAAYTLEEQAKFLDFIRNNDSMGFYLFSHTISEEKREALFKSFEHGQKTADKQRARELEKQGMDKVLEDALTLQSMLESGDTDGYEEARAEFTNEEWPLIERHIPANLLGAA